MDVNLVMFKTDGQRKDFPAKSPVTVIGRGENCDLRVPLVSVSRRHCEITVSGDQVKAKDLASSNGTYVNNKRITEVALQAGDRLVVGPVVFTVQINGVPEEISPVKTKAEQAASDPPPADSTEVGDLQPAAAAEQSVDEAAAAALEPATEEIDPIAALEALAAEHKKPDEET